MKIAVTNHAVSRYMSRVAGADGFEFESVRMLIRELVREGFESGLVRPHPIDPSRRIIPFKSGDSCLFLSLGANTTTFDADVAVIGVLYDNEVGKVGIGMKLEDVSARLAQMQATRPRPPKFAVFIGPNGGNDTIEYCRVPGKTALDTYLAVRRPQQGEVAIYELIDY